MPNMPETIIAMLATAAIGAVWSSCSPDFGVRGVVDRFGQITPTVLFVADSYCQGGKTIELLDRVAAIARDLPTLRRVVVVLTSTNHRPRMRHRYKRVFPTA